MMEVHLLSGRNRVIRSLISQARNRETAADKFRFLLRRLGLFFGYEIADLLEYRETTVVTPMGAEHVGLELQDEAMLVVSSFEDADYFAAGIGEAFSEAVLGKIEAVRNCNEGQWRASIQRAEFPREIPSHGVVVIAKSILASGCTAISLIGKTLEIAKPRDVLVAAIVAHENACREIADEYPYVPIKFVIGELDPILDDRGYVIPGMGNVPERLTVSQD